MKSSNIGLMKWRHLLNVITTKPVILIVYDAFQSVSAISVDPSARGRQLRQRADNSVKLLARRSDNLTGDEVGERESRSAGQDVAAKYVYRRISNC